MAPVAWLTPQPYIVSRFATMSKSNTALIAFLAFLAPLLWLLVQNGDAFFVDDIERGELYYFMLPT